MSVRTTAKVLSVGTSIVSLLTAAALSRADQVTIEKTETVRSSSRTDPQVAVPITVLGKDEISSLRFRLDKMRDQIDLGSGKGWISSDEASALRTKVDLISITVDDLAKPGGFSKARADDLEIQANSLNIAISDAMKNAPTKAVSSSK